MITFCSDFGTADPYAALVKGVILSINPRAEIIDLSHELAAHDVRRAAFFVASSCPVFPSGAVHLCVVDPGVGASRKPILLVTERHFFVGPDNGLFSLAWRASEKKSVYWLKNEKYFFRSSSRTFDARDIFGPVAAYLSLGVSPQEFGPALNSIKLLEFPEPLKRPASKRGDRRFQGEIVYIDRFGNLVTNFPYGLVQGGNVEVKLGSRKMKDLAPNYAAIARGKTAPILEGFGYLEVASNAASAEKLLQAKIGTKVELKLL